MIDQPVSSHIPQMKLLWKTAFADEDGFLDLFFRKAYSPDRCLCAFDGTTVKGMVHWLPCTLEGRKYAYIYALSVAPEYRRQGVARKLMNAAHHLLALEDWAGVILMPQEEGLRTLYEKLGYQTCCSYNEGISGAGADSVPVHRVTGSQYELLRRKYLPQGGVHHNELFFSLMEGEIRFYQGMDFLLAAREEKDHLFGLELLGNAAAAPGLLAALGHTWGRFRTPGKKRNGAMYKALDPAAPQPAYFAFELL